MWGSGVIVCVCACALVRRGWNGIEGRLGQPITPSSTCVSINSTRHTAYCPPRKNPLVPSIGSSVTLGTDYDVIAARKGVHAQVIEAVQAVLTEEAITREGESVEKSAAASSSCVCERSARVACMSLCLSQQPVSSCCSCVRAMFNLR
jgi:hypothetical protein